MPRRGKKRRRGQGGNRPLSDDLIDASPDIRHIVRLQTVDEALRNVRHAVTTAGRGKVAAVLEIVTGKGHNSPGGISRLKPEIERILDGELRGYVVDYCENVDQSGFLIQLK